MPTRRSFLKTLSALLFLLYLPSPVFSEDFDGQLVSGVTTVHILAAEVGSNGVTRSVGVRRVDTNELVLCAPLSPGAELEGLTTPILNLGAEVFLVASAFDGEICTGLESLPSADRKRITFGPPGAPLFLPTEAP